MATMRVARMYGYKQPLRLEEIPVPNIDPTQVLIKVGGAISTGASCHLK
jgi:alcohol dehydrogenase, propanol-preferring